MKPIEQLNSQVYIGKKVTEIWLKYVTKWHTKAMQDNKLVFVMSIIVEQGNIFLSVMQDVYSDKAKVCKSDLVHMIVLVFWNCSVKQRLYIHVKEGDI